VSLELEKGGGGGIEESSGYADAVMTHARCNDPSMMSMAALLCLHALSFWITQSIDFPSTHTTIVSI
jgi:hypothetical protein